MDNIYRDTVIDTFANAGGTYMLPDLRPISPTANVYILSLDDARGRVYTIEEFTPTQLTMFIIENEGYIKQWNTRGTTYGTLKGIGTWIDNGLIYVDVSTIINKDELSLETVLELGRANNQRAIWDHADKVAIETGLVFA